MELMPVKIEILVKANQAYAEFKKVNGELDRMAIKGDLAGHSMSRWTRAGKLAGSAMLGLAGIAGVVAYESIKAAISVQKSQSNLQIAVKNSGVAYAAAKPQIESHTEAMANLGFTTEDTYTALAHMTAATRSPQMALNALAVTADLARFKQISLAQASDIVSRASMGQARGLASLGLAIGKTIPKGATFAQIMKLIEDRTRGAAKAFAGTASGQLAVLQAKFKALEEQLGIALLPTLNKLTQWLIKDGLPKLKELGKWVSTHQGLFKGIVASLATLWAVPKIAGVITAIGTITKALKGLKDMALAASAAESVATGGLLGAAGVAGGVALGAAGAVVGAEAFSMYRDKKKGKALADSLTRAKTEKLPTQTFMGPAGSSNDWSKYIKKIPKAHAPNLNGLGPMPLIDSGKHGHKVKHQSLRSQARQKVGDASGTTVHTNIHLDSKVVASSVANSATHGTPLSGGRRSGG